MLKKINLGCGKNILEGYTNCDILNLDGVDKVFDITKGLPFSDNDVEEIICDYMLCQIASNKEFIFVLNEFHRVLCTSGVARIKVPNACFPETAFRDPADCRYFVPETFTHFDYSHYRYQELSKGEGYKPWRILKIRNISGGTSKKRDRLLIKMQPKK